MGEALGKAGINIDGVCGFPARAMGLSMFRLKTGPMYTKYLRRLALR